MTSFYEAKPTFLTVPVQIANVVTRIHAGNIALPDFQRDFVWDASRTEELIQSIMCQFPIGTFLFWTPAEREHLAYRNFEGAPELDNRKPSELVLDGQQRLTGLYQALTGTGDERYFIKLDEFVDSKENRVLNFHDVDFDKAITSVPVPSSKAQAKRNAEVIGDFHIKVSDLDRIDDWLEENVDSKSLRSLYRRVRDTYIIPLQSYGLQVLTLSSDTPIEAVCTIFETLNRTAKQLGPFELLTAKFYPQNVNLRELWDSARTDYPVLEEYKVDPYNLLQAICVRVHNSAQRSDVLKKLKADHIRDNWAPVVKGMAGVIDMLQSDCGLIAPKWLPYGTLLIPMAAVWPDIMELDTLDRALARERLQQFYWCSVFTTNYDQGANSQAGADFTLLKPWVTTDADRRPEALQELPLNAATFRSATVRRKALYAGVVCLLVKSRAEDFHTSQAMTRHRVQELQIDSHHIFPKKYLSTHEHGENSELILNRTLIDAETNRIIRDKAPSQYLGDMEEAYGEEKLAAVLESHAIRSDPDSGIRNNNYPAFLEERLQVVLKLVKGATGRTVDKE